MNYLVIYLLITFSGVGVAYTSAVEQSSKTSSGAQIPHSLKALTDVQMDDVFRKEEGRIKSAGEGVQTAFAQLERAKDAYTQLRQAQRVFLDGAIALEQERLQKAQEKLDALKTNVKHSQKKGFFARFDFRHPAVQAKITAYLSDAQKEVDVHEKRLATLVNARQQASELDAKVANLH